MPILPKKYVRVSKNVGVWVSNYYQPMAFAVRGRLETSYKLGQYEEEKTPGTGFFVRPTSSRGYRYFLKHVRAGHKPSWWKMVTGRQFSFATERNLAEAAMAKTTDPLRQRILESYANVLALAGEAEYLQRTMRAIKDQSRFGRLSRYKTSLLSSHKSRILRLEQDARFAQINIGNECDAQKIKQFSRVTEAFAKVAASHRIWHMDESMGGTEAHQVFFDLGIFDFIQSPLMTPLMRDANDNTYWLYPDYLIAARNSVDFDIHPLSDTPFIYRELPYDQVLESMSPSDYSSYQHRHHHKHHPAVSDPDGNLLNPAGSYGSFSESSGDKVRMRVVGELYIPSLHLRFCSQDVVAMRDFVHALNDYRKAIQQDDSVQ